MIDLAAFLGVLGSFGVSLSASAFWDFLKECFSEGQEIDISEFTEQFESFLEVHGVDVSASTIIEMFASEGLLSIKGSSLFAPDQISMGAGEGAQFMFGHDSVSETDKTRIEARGNAEIRGSNAAIVQNPDGSISFMVGKKK